MTGQSNEVYRSLVKVLSRTYDSRKFFAFGTIDYGERKTMIARSKAVDADGNLPQSITTPEMSRDKQVRKKEAHNCQYSINPVFNIVSGKFYSIICRLEFNCFY